MAFRKLIHEDRRVPLLSLIDMIFILLIFFIISSVMIQLTKGESKLFVPTPKNEPGEAQILIQIIDADRYLWLDHTAIDTLRRYGNRLGHSATNADKVQMLVERLTVTREVLYEKLEAPFSEKTTQKKDYFVVIRCPDYLPYYYATSIVEKLADNPYFEYGCVSGTLEEITSSENIYIEGNILQIDF